MQGRPRKNSFHSCKCWHTSSDTLAISQADASHYDAWQQEKAKFEWTTEQQAAFEELKSAIASAPVLAPFHPKRDTLVICDGSPTGLRGGLFQKTQHGYHPLHYVNRTLPDTENTGRRYSQIERETLAVEFATSRLQMDLLGEKHFQLARDHKPLLPLFNNPQAKLSPRIENAEPGLYHDTHPW